MKQPNVIYLAGPMSGKTHYNVAAFTEQATAWRNVGYEVITPFETNSTVWRKHYGRDFDPYTDTCDYGDPILREMVAEDFAALCRADYVAVLPGWEQSKGARAEVEVARNLHIPVLDSLTGKLIQPVSAAADPTAKPTNPKDAIGSHKLPLHLWPEHVSALGSLALMEGALKYGRSNFRAIGVRASIYVDALRRHIAAYWEGEDADPDSGLPHLAHALACIAILVDAQAAGRLADDRAYPGGHRAAIDGLTPHVKRLKEKYQGRDVKHYTIVDPA